MKGVILLNGEPYEREIDGKDSLVYCCDGAYLWAKDKTHIDENIGDFDSLFIAPIPSPKKIYPEEKNFTDGEIALRKMIEAGVEQITVYGAGGKREDHFLGNLHLMYYAFSHNVPCVIQTNYSKMFFTDGETKLDGYKGLTISLIPFFGDALVESSYGLHYPLNGLRLERGTCRGISNLVESDKAGFFCKEGILLVCVDSKKKGEAGG